MKGLRSGGELVADLAGDDYDVGTGVDEPQTATRSDDAATNDEHATPAQVEEERQPWVVHAVMVSGGAKTVAARGASLIRNGCQPRVDGEQTVRKPRRV